MAKLNIARILFSELTALKASPRVREPDLVMNDQAQVRAFAAAGSEGGTLAPLYIFNSAQISDVIRPGDTVIDLACGPANQLAQVARLNPDTRFLGIDLAAGMLEQASAVIGRFKLTNVDFTKGDITDLRFVDDASVDAVISTLALHHLPDTSALGRAFQEVARILKPQGGLFLHDLGHLRSETSISDFAAQYAKQQPDVFTLDYRNSMRAAFSLHDLRKAASVFGPRVTTFSTFLAPYMVAIRSAPRRPFDRSLLEAFRSLRASLPAHQKNDLRNLQLFFRLGGLRSPYLG